jgi:hypothetical protein
MSGDAKPAEIDGEYRCEEKRKQKTLDSKHTAPKFTSQLLVKIYGVNLSTGYFKSDGVDRQQLPTDLYKCVGELQLSTVKRSKLDALDVYDTASAAFVDKFMVVNYFTCLDDIANAIDDLFALEDLYVTATGDSDKPTVEQVPFEPSDDGFYDNYKSQVNSFGETSGYKRDSGQLVPKPVVATKTHWREGSATRAAKTKKQAPQQQMAVVAAPSRPHAGSGGGAGQSPPATAPITTVVALP